MLWLPKIFELFGLYMNLVPISLCFFNFGPSKVFFSFLIPVSLRLFNFCPCKVFFFSFLVPVNLHFSNFSPFKIPFLVLLNSCFKGLKLESTNLQRLKMNKKTYMSANLRD